jgi:hypothetical protein
VVASFALRRHLPALAAVGSAQGARRAEPNALDGGATWLLAVTAAYLWVTASPAPDTSLAALLPLFPFLFLATLSLALGRSRNRALAWACWGVTPCLPLTALLLFGLFH